MTIYDRSVREAACGLFERGLGHEAAAARLGVPLKAVRQWHLTYRAVGRDALLDMGSRRTYDYETKVAAASAVVDGGASKPEAMGRFGIASVKPLENWCRLYREGGADALRPKPKGRPRGSGAKSAPETREQELEREVRRLEAQVAYLKNDSPEGGARLAAQERAAAVAALSGRFPLADLLAAASLPRSPCYYALSHPKGPTRPGLRPRVAEIFGRLPNGVGHRQIAMELRAVDGERIADKTVLKMMREMGLRCGIRRETDYHRYNSYRGVVGALLEEAEADALTYLDFPAEHRRRIRTNNVQERVNREMRRRSRVVQVFPSAESMLRLVGAEQDEDWSSRRYISPESMGKLLEPAAPEPAESEASRRRGLMVVETAMELADGGRRAA